MTLFWILTLRLGGNRLPPFLWGLNYVQVDNEVIREKK